MKAGSHSTHRGMKKSERGVEWGGSLRGDIWTRLIKIFGLEFWICGEIAIMAPFRIVWQKNGRLLNLSIIAPSIKTAFAARGALGVKCVYYIFVGLTYKRYDCSRNVRTKVLM